MKVLPDTSVWSLALRRKRADKLSKPEQQLTARLAEAIQDGVVAMIGPVRQELLSGIKEPAQFESLRNALQAYVDEPIETSDYEEAASFYNLCRSHGVECGPVDILICTIASRREWQVISNDAALNRCLEIVHSAKASRAKKPGTQR